jgi:putative transcriptional regulator
MHPDESPPSALKGSLLLADPSLRDPNFFRTVLLLVDHSTPTGAWGYVLNRPFGKKVRDVLPGDEFAALREVPIFQGGPVGQEHLIFSSFRWLAAEQRLLSHSHLSMADAIEALESGATVRAFLGYSGWGAKQLERELKNHSWITCRPDHTTLTGPSGEDLWTAQLTSMGPYYELLAATPEQVELN